MNHKLITLRTSSIRLLVLLCSSLLCSCNAWKLPSEYVGTWKSTGSIITVRTGSLRSGYQFTSDVVKVSFKINADKTVSGSIGNTDFPDGSLRKNWGLPPSVTGVSYIIKCGTIGKIFPRDPLGSKEVEIWLSPLKNDLQLKAELRFTENMAAFPMAGIVFTKAGKE